MGCPWHRMLPKRLTYAWRSPELTCFFVGISYKSWILKARWFMYVIYINRISNIAALISFEGFTEIKNPRMFWETSCAQCLTFFLQPIKQQTPSFAQIIVRFRVTNPSTGHWRLHAVDGSEIPNKHLEYLKCWNPVNNGINYDKLP